MNGEPGDAGQLRAELEGLRRRVDELRASEERLQAILDAARDAIAVHDAASGDFIAFNRSAAELFGFAKDGGAKPLAVVASDPPYTSEAARDLVVRAARGEPQVFEWAVRDAQDRQRWLEVVLTRAEIGGTCRVISVVRDVAERKEAENRLKRTREQYRAIAEGVPLIVSILDQDWNLVENLPGAEQVHGYATADFLPGPGKLVHPEDAKTVEVAFASLRENPEQAIVVRFRHRHNAGGYIWLETVARNLLEDPAIRGVVAVTRDVSEEVKAEQLRRGSEARFKAAVENLPFDLWLCDPDGRCVVQNSESVRKWGLLVDRRLEDAEIPEAMRSRWIDNCRRALAGEVVDVRASYTVHDQERHFHEIVAPVLEADRVCGLVGVHIDITEQVQNERERIRLQEQLVQSQKMEAIGLLAGGVAHDFNNLLTVMVGYLELGATRLAREHPSQDDLTQVRLAARRASDLTRQLLAFSRTQVLSMRVVDLNGLVRNLERMLRRLIGENIEIVSVLDPSIPEVWIDPSQIELVIINLVVNSRDAMPQGGKLTIQTSFEEVEPGAVRTDGDLRPGPHVLLQVSDTGCGMDEETQRRIFEPFFTTKEQGKGTGLGLATAYGIVRQHGGHVGFRSAPARGTTFLIYIPPIWAHPCRDKTPISFGPIQTAGNEVILVVEDDTALRTLTHSILEGVGYRVLEASSAEDALRIAGDPSVEVDLLLTDVIMPGMNGRELHGRLVTLRPGLKVLYMSGYSADVIAPQGVLEENVNLLVKPFHCDELTRKVRQVLGPNSK